MPVRCYHNGAPVEWREPNERAGRRAPGTKRAEPHWKAPPEYRLELGRSGLPHGLRRRLRHGLFRGPWLVLGGELLFDLGGNGVYVHPVELGCILESLA